MKYLTVKRLFMEKPSAMPTQAKPPFRLALAALFLDGVARTAEEALALLTPLYGREKLCRPASVEKRLYTLKAVGIVQSVEDPEGSTPRWTLTRTGRERVLKAL